MADDKNEALTLPRIDSATRKHKMSLEPVLPKERPPEERIGDFDEIMIPFTPEEAMAEAERCILCPGAQCQKACPLSNYIPMAMWLITQGRFEEAAEVYRQTSPMPEICGRVCPQERLCEGACVLGKKGTPVALGRLEAFVADYHRQKHGGKFPVRQPGPDTGKKVAVIGAGPAGLTVAELMREAGHAVTVYEKWPEGGGLLVYGIPSFKLDKELVHSKLESLEEIGVEFVYGVKIGQDIPLAEIIEKYDAVFLGTGANVDAKVRVEGLDLDGVYEASEFLARANVPPEMLPEDLRAKGVPEIGDKVFVIGGGDTAMDCVRTSIRLQKKAGKDVNVVCAYRRTEEQMPCCVREREHAREEGAVFEWLTAPVRFIGENGKLKAIEFIRMELGEPDESGRARPVKIEGSEYTVEADTVILAIGYWPDPLLGETTEGLETHKWGLIKADENGVTSIPGVFAGGDNVHGPDLVSTAVAAARRAARSMLEYLAK